VEFDGRWRRPSLPELEVGIDIKSDTGLVA
jgi:hypothetical protein